MLYVTTREKKDAFTVHRTLASDRGPDGGFFVPLRFPKFSAEEIGALKDKRFGDAVAEILEQLFPVRLNGRDVEFCTGRHPVHLTTMNRRIIIGETWHNPELDFARLVRDLGNRAFGEEVMDSGGSDWVWIAIRVGVLFGIFGELERMGIADSQTPVDITVAAGDFSLPMAAWYAREMGLPIGIIICSCNENSGVWELLHRGELHTDATAVRTATPDGDAGVPPDLERLIYGRLGWDAVGSYVDVCRRGGVYAPGQEMVDALRAGLFSAVVSQKRMAEIISSVYRTAGYILDPYAALAFGGLQDYRASTGESRSTLLIAERSPACGADTVAKAMGLTTGELKNRLGLA